MTMRALFAALVLSLLLATGQAADYGVKVRFQKATPVSFPDFVLTYLGERRVTSERYPRGFIYHDFRVAGAPGMQTVSWSAGTGEIAPAPFRVGSQRFTIELSRADQLGPLQQNELVISRTP